MDSIGLRTREGGGGLVDHLRKKERDVAGWRCGYWLILFICIMHGIHTQSIESLWRSLLRDAGWLEARRRKRYVRNVVNLYFPFASNTQRPRHFQLIAQRLNNFFTS